MFRLINRVNVVKDFRKKRTLRLTPYLSIVLFLVFGCSQNTNFENDVFSSDLSQGKSEQKYDIAVAPPPFTEGIFPCSNCHNDIEPNPHKRKLVDMHDSISAIFNHDSANRWCLDCHDLKNRDYLRLASGTLISFDESYKLCGQCHGEKLRDWKAGVHGKRTGYWNGKKQYLLCVNCHSPHSPHFKPIKPLPPPVRQKDIKLRMAND
jgi:hypothetical protein